MLIEIRVGVDPKVQSSKKLAHGLDSRIAADRQPFQLLAGEFRGIAN